MGKAKDIVLKPISPKTARAFVRRVHYSGKVAQNSQLHFGVYLNNRLEGALQFGPSLDKRKIQGLVSGSGWHEFIELNRMAFTDALPRNSESRAIAIAFRLLRKHAPQIKWCVSFADATQCGDGTIYRASGFVLTGIKDNNQIIRLEDGRVVHKMSLEQIQFGTQAEKTPFRDAPEFMGITKGAYSLDRYLKAKGVSYESLPGFQLRYIYFIDPAYRARLTVPEIPFSEIEKRGASMYKGEKITRPLDGKNITTSDARRFDSDPDALKTI